MSNNTQGETKNTSSSSSSSSSGNQPGSFWETFSPLQQQNPTSAQSINIGIDIATVVANLKNPTMPLKQLFTECAVRYFTFSPMLSGDDNIGIIEGRCISELDNNNPSSHMGCDAHHDGTLVIPVESKILAADNQNKSFGGSGGSQKDGKDRMDNCTVVGQQGMRNNTRSWFPGSTCLPACSDDGISDHAAARAVAADGVREVVRMIDGEGPMDIAVDNGAPGTAMTEHFSRDSPLPVNTTRTVGWMNDMGVARDSLSLQNCKFFPPDEDDWRRSGTLITKMHNGRPLFNLTHGTYDAQQQQPYYYANVQWAERPNIILKMNRQDLLARANHVITSNVRGSGGPRINNLRNQDVARIMGREALIAHNNMNTVDTSTYSYESQNDSADKAVAQGRRHFMGLDPVLGILYVTGKHKGDIGQALMGLLAFITGNKLWLITHDRWLFNWLCNCEILTNGMRWRRVPLRGLWLNCHAGEGGNYCTGFKLTGPPVLGGANATAIIQLKTRETDLNRQISDLQELLVELTAGRPLQTTRAVLPYLLGNDLNACCLFDTRRDLLENARRLCHVHRMRCPSLDDTNVNQWMNTIENIDFPAREVKGRGRRAGVVLQLGLVRNDDAGRRNQRYMIVKMLLQWLKDIEQDYMVLKRLVPMSAANSPQFSWLMEKHGHMEELKLFLLKNILKILEQPNFASQNVETLTNNLLRKFLNVMNGDNDAVLNALRGNIEGMLKRLGNTLEDIQGRLGKLSSNSCSTTKDWRDRVWNSLWLPMWETITQDILKRSLNSTEKEALLFSFDQLYANRTEIPIEDEKKHVDERLHTLTQMIEHSESIAEHQSLVQDKFESFLQGLIQEHNRVKMGDLEAQRCLAMSPTSTPRYQERLEKAENKTDLMGEDFQAPPVLYTDDDYLKMQQQQQPEPKSPPPPPPRPTSSSSSSSTSRERSPAFQAGDKVILTGLTGQVSSRNNQTGTIVGWNNQRQMWAVEMRGDQETKQEIILAPPLNIRLERARSRSRSRERRGGKKTKSRTKRKRKTRRRRKRKKKTIRKRRKRKKKTIKKRRKRGRKTRRK